MARLLFIAFLFVSLYAPRAQAKEGAGDTANKYSLGIGAQMSTSGWKVLATYEHQVKPRLGHFFQLSFSEVTLGYYNKREGSKLFPSTEPSRSYIPGKINRFYAVQFGHGREIIIVPLNKTSQLALCARIQAGVGMGILVPYYLRVVYDDNNGQRPHYIIKDEKYDAHAAHSRFLDGDYVLGRSAKGRANHDISLPPGGYIDAAVCLRRAKRKKFDVSLTAGTNFSVYFQTVPVMAGQKAVPYYGNVYLTVSPSYSWK
ncbi:MAG: hypothetical protein JSS82_16710 [Bacteroidetes bacterium]|nr:hypothetical protein [Bacteroidota bacterium]